MIQKYRRINRRLMCVAIGWVLLAGCAPYHAYEMSQEDVDRQGDVVELVIGGKGQIMCGHKYTRGYVYSIRVMTENGPEIVHLYDWELKCKVETK